MKTIPNAVKYIVGLTVFEEKDYNVFRHKRLKNEDIMIL